MLREILHSHLAGLQIALPEHERVPRAGARYALVLGERDLEAGEVAVKDLAQHSQESVALSVQAVTQAVTGAGA